MFYPSVFLVFVQQPCPNFFIPLPRSPPLRLPTIDVSCSIYAYMLALSPLRPQSLNFATTSPCLVHRLSPLCPAVLNTSLTCGGYIPLTCVCLAVFLLNARVILCSVMWCICILTALWLLPFLCAFSIYNYSVIIITYRHTAFSWWRLRFSLVILLLYSWKTFCTAAVLGILVFVVLLLLVILWRLTLTFYLYLEF